MRAIALILAASLAIPPAAFAADESSDLAAIRAELSALRAEVASLRPPAPSPRVTPPPPRSMSVPSSVAPFNLLHRGLAAIGGPLIGVGGVPIFAYPGYGGGSGVALGDTPTWTGAHTFSADVTLNGGVGALGFGVGETITAADGSLTIGGGSGLDMTGGVTAVYYRLNDVNVSISETGTNDLALTADGAVAGTFSSAGLSVTQVTATSADGGSSVGIRASSAVAGIGWQETDAAADNKVWDILANGTKLTHRAVNDANTAGTTWLEVARTGTTIDSVTFPTDVTFNGGVGALTFGAGETIVLGDSNLDITGGVEVTTTLRVASGNGIISGGAGIGVSIDAAGVSANPTTLGGQVAIAHLSGGGGLATGAVAGTGCGTASAPTQSGNDIGGKLGATCGSGGTVANPIVTVTFADAYSTAPFCTIAPADAATAAVMVSAQIYPVTSTTTLAAQCGGGTCPTGTFSWSYSCSQ